MSTEEDPFEGGNPEEEFDMMAPMLVDKLQVSWAFHSNIKAKGQS